MNLSVLDDLIKEFIFNQWAQITGYILLAVRHKRFFAFAISDVLLYLMFFTTVCSVEPMDIEFNDYDGNSF